MICGRHHSTLPAISGINGTDIYPFCEAEKSLIGILDEMKTEIFKTIAAQEIVHGRIEAFV